MRKFLDTNVSVNCKLIFTTLFDNSNPYFLIFFWKCLKTNSILVLIEHFELKWNQFSQRPTGLMKICSVYTMVISDSYVGLKKPLVMKRRNCLRHNLIRLCFECLHKFA